MHLGPPEIVRSSGQMQSTVPITGKPNTLIWNRKKNVFFSTETYLNKHNVSGPAAGNYRSAAECWNFSQFWTHSRLVIMLALAYTDSWEMSYRLTCMCLDWVRKLKNLERVHVDTMSDTLVIEPTPFQYEWQPPQFSTLTGLLLCLKWIKLFFLFLTNPIKAVAGKQNWAWCNEEFPFFPVSYLLCAFSVTSRSKTQRPWANIGAPGHNDWLFCPASGFFFSGWQLSRTKDDWHQLGPRHTWFLSGLFFFWGRGGLKSIHTFTCAAVHLLVQHR